MSVARGYSVRSAGQKPLEINDWRIKTVKLLQLKGEIDVLKTVESRLQIFRKGRVTQERVEG